MEDPTRGMLAKPGILSISTVRRSSRGPLRPQLSGVYRKRRGASLRGPARAPLFPHAQGSEAREALSRFFSSARSRARSRRMQFFLSWGISGCFLLRAPARASARARSGDGRLQGKTSVPPAQENLHPIEARRHFTGRSPRGAPPGPARRGARGASALLARYKGSYLSILFVGGRPRFSKR
jgi:hypothetical protein